MLSIHPYWNSTATFRKECVKCNKNYILSNDRTQCIKPVDLPLYTLCATYSYSLKI